MKLKEGLKILIPVLVILTLVLSPFHMVKAVSGWLIVLKEFVLDLISRLIARTLLSILSNSITQTILTIGRDGTPALVLDWRGFLEEAQYRGEDIARGIIADAVFNSQICPYFGGDILNSFGGTLVNGLSPAKYRVNSLQYYGTRNQCTLPGNFNVGLFRNDFAAGGGWAVWNQIIQPQNNFYGVYGDTLSEVSHQRSFEQGTDNSETMSGSGYTSARTGCVTRGANSQCVILGQILTPGDLIGKGAAATIDRELDWLVSVDEIEEALVSLAGIVINKLSSFISGSLLGTNGPGLGADAPPGDAEPRSRQDCVNACIGSCPPPLASCIYGLDPYTNQRTATNQPCAPLDTDPRTACVSDCQTKGCN